MSRPTLYTGAIPFSRPRLFMASTIRTHLAFKNFPDIRQHILRPRVFRRYLVGEAPPPPSSPRSAANQSKKSKKSKRPPPSLQASAAIHSKAPSLVLQASRSRGYRSSSPKQVASSTAWKFPTPLTHLSKTISDGRTTGRARYFPEVSDRVVAYWLLGSAASVFGIVVFGGLTRLTESGYDLYPIFRVKGIAAYFLVA